MMAGPGRRPYTTLPHVWDCLPHLPVVWAPSTADVLWPDDMRKPEPLPYAEMQAVVLERRACIPLFSCRPICVIN